MSTQATQSVGSPRPTPARVLVLGATGMVGRSWIEMLDQRGIAHRGLARPGFDLLEPDTLGKLIEPGDALVVNAAAWTDVDGAESDPAGAMRANGQSVGMIAERCAELGVSMIHYSTDYVFDGRADSPYPIDAPIHPCNQYGESKAEGERLIREHAPEHLIIRTSWVYAPWGKNFVRTIARFASEKPELHVVNDQHGRPTSATYLAESSLALYLAGARGTWHASDGGACSWHGLATAIARRINPACSVHPCGSDAYPRPAYRPAYSVLDIAATEALIGPRRGWETNLASVLDRLEEA